MKKYIALTLVFLMCLSVFAGCKGQDNADKSKESSTVTDTNTGNAEKPPEESGDSDSNLTDPGTFPIVKDKVSITVYTHASPDWNTDDYDAREGNVFSEWYEELTNVQMDFIMAPSSNEITEHLGMLLSSNQVPDIMLSNGFSSAQQALYGNQGILMEITELVEKNAPRIKAMWDTHPEVAEAITLGGGKKYAVNYNPHDPHGKTWNKMWVYKPWLDELGLKAPETTEEFYNTLVAFRDQDPNGNNKKDEIPLIGNISWVAWDPFVYLMSGFIYNDYLTNVHVDNGKVFAAYMQPEYKEGLKWIATLYKEGLIAPETFSINDIGVYNTIANQETNVVGFMPTHAPFTATPLHYEDFVPVPPLTGPNGIKTIMKNYIIPTNGAVISADCEYPEVAIRVLDGLFDVDVHLRAFEGREGIEWAEAEPGMTNKNGDQAKYRKIPAEPDSDTQSTRNVIWPMALYFLDYLSTGYRDYWYVDPDEIDYIGPLEKATEELYVPTFPSDDKLLPPNLIYSDEQATEISDLQALIDETRETYKIKFILGEADIDNEWDAYIAELKAVGIERYLEIVQSAYESMK